MPLRIGFAGTPTFAAVVLAELLQRHFHVVLALTQPDTQAGRGKKVISSPVKQLALVHQIAVQQPPSLRTEEAVEALRCLELDVLLVVAYGLILPPSVLDLPRLGCINVHASLLPRWRGAAPIQRAIMAGDAETGVCIMRMDAGLDTGPVYASRNTPIHPDETFGTLHDRLAALGAEAVCAVLSSLERCPKEPTPQSSDGVTYAAKILKPDCRVDWRQPAAQLERQLRALDPSPGALTTLREQAVKLWRGQVRPGSTAHATPGTILSAGTDGIDVQCGQDVLRITQLQRAGGRRMDAVDLLRGFRLAPGDRFGD